MKFLVVVSTPSIYHGVLHVFLFPLQVLDKLNLEVLDFWIYLELVILDFYATRCIKHAIISVHLYFIGIFISSVILSLFLKIYAHLVL